MTRLTRRPGFTLVELLVAMVIMLVLLTLALVVGPRFNENRKVNTASDQLQGWLLIAKQRAIRDRAPRGLYLSYSSSGITQLQYVEQPDPYTAFTCGTLSVPQWDTSQPLPPAGQNNFPPNPRCGVPAATGASMVTLSTGLGYVNAGDQLEIVDPPSIHTIYSVSPVPNSTTGASLILGTSVTASALPTQPSYVPGTTAFATTSYRVIRQPQALLGEPPLSMPVDTAIDPGLSRVGNLATPITGNPTIIMFTPSGQMSTLGQAPGNVILWVSDTLNINPHRGQIVVIYQRTGLIGAHPADPTNQAGSYAFTQDGQSSGL